MTFAPIARTLVLVHTRLAVSADIPAILTLYRELQPDDPALSVDAANAFALEIFERPGLDFIVLVESGEIGEEVVGSVYLNVIPNLTRGGRPYAVIENVIVQAARRGEGLGKQVMRAATDRADAAGCYKVMLMTGSTNPDTHAFYKSCGFDSDAKHAYLHRP